MLSFLSLIRVFPHWTSLRYSSKGIDQLKHPSCTWWVPIPKYMTQGFSVNPELLDIHYPLTFNHHPKRNAVFIHLSPGAAPHPTSPPAPWSFFCSCWFVYSGHVRSGSHIFVVTQWPTTGALFTFLYKLCFIGLLCVLPLKVLTVLWRLWFICWRFRYLISPLIMCPLSSANLFFISYS